MSWGSVNSLCPASFVDEVSECFLVPFLSVRGIPRSIGRDFLPHVVHRPEEVIDVHLGEWIPEMWEVITGEQVTFSLESHCSRICCGDIYSPIHGAEFETWTAPEGSIQQLLEKIRNI